MSNTIKNLKLAKANLAKIEKQFKNGKAGYDGFTVDISFGGNEHHSIIRVPVGGISDAQNASQEFLDLITRSVKGSLAFWEKATKQDIAELQKALED